jgi:ATP-dependent Clp protease adaptor protein ClpS
VSVSFLQPTQRPPVLAPETEPLNETRRDQPVRVLLHNDDYTPAEYVVKILELEFGLGIGKATWVTFKAHVTGTATVGHYRRADAESRVATAHDRARADGWPLHFSIEDDD